MAKYLGVIFDLADYEDEEEEADGYDLMFEFLAEQGFSDCYKNKTLPASLAVRKFNDDDTETVKSQILAFCNENEIEMENLVVALMDGIVHETEEECEEFDD
ncbi:MAG: hypothetical protein OEZ34_09040 [Spirochaetia bacterium]|nr:hypothetical protein [Spirochaetia bacterium]